MTMRTELRPQMHHLWPAFGPTVGAAVATRRGSFIAFFATGSRRKALAYVVLCGLAEPVCDIIG